MKLVKIQVFKTKFCLALSPSIFSQRITKLFLEENYYSTFRDFPLVNRITNFSPKMCTTKIYFHKLKQCPSPHFLSHLVTSDSLHFLTSELYKVSFTQNMSLNLHQSFLQGLSQMPVLSVVFPELPKQFSHLILEFSNLSFILP